MTRDSTAQHYTQKGPTHHLSQRVSFIYEKRQRESGLNSTIACIDFITGPDDLMLLTVPHKIGLLTNLVESLK